MLVGGATIPSFGEEVFVFSFFCFVFFLWENFVCHHLNVLKAFRGKGQGLIWRCGVGFREEHKQKCDFLACHLSPSRSLVFLLNGWAHFARDG